VCRASVVSARDERLQRVQLWEWVCRFERVSECKSETLGFLGLYWVELSVCIIPPIIYNLLPPWTYPVLGNHVKSACLCFICVCFRSSMHNKNDLLNIDWVIISLRPNLQPPEQVPYLHPLKVTDSQSMLPLRNNLK